MGQYTQLEILNLLKSNVQNKKRLINSVIKYKKYFGTMKGSFKDMEGRFEEEVSNEKIL